MKLHAIRSVSALGLAIVLAACGGGQADQPTLTAATVTMATASGVTAQAKTAMPAPDCAADGCKGPRIIDANAEAYRYDAMRRAAADEAANTNT
jgi:high-affinity K+ transport system ATPase subunit B